MDSGEVMEGVHEYNEGYPVLLEHDPYSHVLTIRATNQGGHDSTDVDLTDLLRWLAKHHPRLIYGALDGEESLRELPKGNTRDQP